MSKELTTTEKKEVALTGGQKLQVQLMTELEKAGEELGQGFTDYGKQCMLSSIGGLVTFCKTNGIQINQLDPVLLKLSLQRIGYVELNYSAGEVYFDVRKNTKANDGTYVATIKAQGVGNEKLVRKYGVGIKPITGLHTPWLIREGDEFVLPSYDGLEVIPPKWIRKSLNGKVIAVCYPVQKVDGTCDFLFADRESVKANIIAQIRQNTLYSIKEQTKKDELYNKLNADAETMTTDEFINKYSEFVNPTYTSGGSKESMIIRKMKNNALNQYPKEYENAFMRDAALAIQEDFDESLKEKPIINREKDVVATVEKEIVETPASENAPQDFEVEETEVEESTSAPVEEETEQEPTPDDCENYEEMF